MKSLFKINPVISLIVTGWFIFTSINAQEIENSYDYWKNYRFDKNIQTGALPQFIIISSRNLDTINYSVREKGVNPKNKLFYFVAVIIGDSCILTPYSKLADAMKVMPDSRNFLIFVNGHGKSFEANLGRGVLLEDRYKLNVILFEWPTDNRTLQKTAVNARKVTPGFALFINEFTHIKNEKFANCHSSVIFHSMGNHIARNIAKSCTNNEQWQNTFDNIILNSAALRQWRHTQWVEKLNIQKQIYIISNKGDYPLHGVWFLRKFVPLGLKAKAPHAKNAVYIDFSLIANKAHNYYTGKTELEKQNQQVYDFYNTIFQGTAVDTSKREVFKPKENGLGFYIY